MENKSDYEKALTLMEELIEDYDYNKFLIEVLSISIERWEDESAEFNKFNKRIRRLNSLIAEILEASYEVLKRLFIRVFIDKQSVI